MIVCFDLETTGLDKYNDKIIEFAMVKFDEKTFTIIDTFTSLIDPEVSIPELITSLTSINDSDVAWAPKFVELRNDIINFIWDLPVVGHNVYFDVDFFANNGVNLDNNICIDTFFLSNFLCFKESSLNLEMLCDSFWISFSWAHRALNDVHATIRLFQKLIETFDKLDNEKKHLLLYTFNMTNDKNILFLKDFLFKNIDSNLLLKDFEEKILSNVWKLDNDDVLIVNKDIDINDMSFYFNKLWFLEKRDNQMKMTNLVMDSFSNNKKIVIEAPTWLWKSFAYLIPSILHSLNTWEKVFVSTKTKALQDQLYNRDLKYLKETLWLDFRYTKLKWKKNYVSIKLFFDEYLFGDFTYTKVWFLSKILLWLLDTKYWELDELNFYWQEYNFLKFINADNLSVLDDKNDYRRYEFLFKARVWLASSNIIIINHSLLFWDISVETWVLWKITNLVIDEWHNIEDTITDSLRQKYSLKWFLEYFDIVEKILSKINSNKIELMTIKERLVSKLELIDDYIFNYVNSKLWRNNWYKTILLKRDFFLWDEFSNLLKKIELDFIDIVDILATNENHNFSKEIVLFQWVLDNIKIMLDINSDWRYIKILNVDDNTWVSFEYTLLNPWEYLIDNLWKNVKSCVLTSATLKIWWNFDYFKKILLLDDFLFYSFESDFDYKKQATLFIPTDLWDIKYNNNIIILNFLSDFYTLVKWKVLTLFTSYSSIKEVYSALNKKLKLEWVNLYAQWIAWSKVKLLNHYLDDPSNSILLWTDSFWEWVDIPWDDLKYLVIHKFPFIVPTDPIFQARSIFFKDPFLEYSIPKAIIKLKQWFWRLIRTKSDTWIVILLDNRIYTTTWWEAFYDAFPDAINIKKWNSQNFFNILGKR